jgi:hypothetical protein
MTTTKQRTGSCLCGAVRITANQANNRVGACHCSMCRTWGGGPLMAIDCGTEVEIEGEDSISVFESSDWAERGFCSKCGTHLYYLLKHNRQYLMAAGFFTDSDGLNFDHQVFIDEKPDFYEFSNKTKNVTGAEVFARFISSS